MMNPKNAFLCVLVLGTLVSLASAAQTRKVRLIIDQLADKTPGNAALFIAGNMNNWNPADSNYRFQQNAAKQYELFVEFPEGINEFKVTRGSWDTGETAVKGFPLANRALVLKKDTVIRLVIQDWQDNYKMPAKVHTTSKNVRVLDTAFAIPQLNRTRKVWVYLPPDYEVSGKKYPVIYMHDGQNIFDSYTAGYGEWGVDELMDSMYLKKSPMAIIVGIDHGGQHRLTEYNPYSNERFGTGRGADYVDFLVQTLKPYIDQKFRTKSSVKHTSIAGSSMGGLISMYAVARYPQVFGKAGVFSPAFWLSPPIYDYVSQKNIRRQKIYFVAGDLESNEMVPDMTKMYEQLLLQGVPKKQLEMKAAPDGKHSEWFWHREFPAFYDWIMN